MGWSQEARVLTQRTAERIEADRRASHACGHHDCLEPPMIDHLGITVRDYAASKDFYLNALAPLGIGVRHRSQRHQP
jgi:hypothetical protein